MRKFSASPYSSSPSFAIKRFAWGVVIISVVAMISVLLHVGTFSQALEVDLTGIILLISIEMLKRLYQEHEACFHQEQKLKETLIHQIYKNFADLPPKEVMIKYIDEFLERQSSPYTRMETLTHYRQDHDALEEFLENLRRQQSEITVLKNLGLCWDHASSNNSEYEKEEPISFQSQL